MNNNVLITKEQLFKDINKKENPIIVIYNNTIVAYNKSASKLWNNNMICEDLRIILGEDLKDVIDNFEVPTDKQCFYEIKNFDINTLFYVY